MARGPAHLDGSGSDDAIQWTRNPDQIIKKVKKRKKKKHKSVDSASDAPGNASGSTDVEWSRNSPNGANTKTKKKKASEVKSVGSSSDAPDDVPKSRKKKKKKKKDVAYEWSRVPTSQPMQQGEGFDDDEVSLNSSNSRGAVPLLSKTKSTSRINNESTSNHSRRSVKSSSSHKPSLKKTKSTKRIADDSTISNHSRRSVTSSSNHKPKIKRTKSSPSMGSSSAGDSNHDRSTRSAAASRAAIRRAKSSRSVDSTNRGSNHDRSTRSAASSSRTGIKRAKSSRSVDSSTNRGSNHDRSTRSAAVNRAALRRAKSTRSVDSTNRDSNHDRSTRSTSSRKGLRKFKSARSFDSTGNYSLDRSPKKGSRNRAPRRVKSTPIMDLDEELPSNDQSRKPLMKTKSTQSMSSSSRTPRPKNSRNVDMMGNIKNNQSPTLSPPPPKTIVHITSKRHFDDASDSSTSGESQITSTSHDDQSLDESTHRQEEQEKNDSPSSTEIDYEAESTPKKRHIPKNRQSDPVRIDFAGQILPTSSHESKKSEGSKVSDGPGVASRLRKELEEKSRGIEDGALQTIEDLEDHGSRRDQSFTSQSIDQQKHLQSMLKALEKFEVSLMEEQNVLELAKQSLESRVFEQVQRQGELETVRQGLEERYQKLKLKFPDPVDKILARREELETENQVLKLRLKRQEDTLEKYQQPKMREKNREIFRVSEVMMASVSSIAQSTSASQSRFELMGLQAKIRERNETISEQSSKRDELNAELKKAHQEVLVGDEIRQMQARVTELENEKGEFMKEIARLQQEGKDLQEDRKSGSSRGFRRTRSMEEEEDKADIADMKSILEDENQDVGFIGWLFGAQQS